MVWIEEIKVLIQCFRNVKWCSTMEDRETTPQTVKYNHKTQQFSVYAQKKWKHASTRVHMNVHRNIIVVKMWKKPFYQLMNLYNVVYSYN
jgi:hypothetical protein